MSASVQTSAGPSRVVFLDLARAVATLMMLQGHTADALLGAAYRTGTLFEAWSAVRGLTSPAFLLVSGFAFGVVTVRDIGRARLAEISRRRLRRFGFFLLLGYALHFPAANLAGLPAVTPDGWRAFISVDILQCIAASLALLQLVATAVRTPRAFTAASLGLVVMVYALAPWLWRLGSDLPLPEFLAAYLVPATGSIFPLFPWLAYCALGAALGTAYAADGTTASGLRLARRLAPVGAGMLALSLAVRATAMEIPVMEALLVSGPSPVRPSQFLFQAGWVCLVLALLAALSDTVRGRRLPVLQAFARESLVVYVVHLPLVYGSAWNYGLRQRVGASLPPAAVVACVLLMWGAMALLALQWSGLKARSPVAAGRVRLAVLGTLAAMLLV